MYGFLVARGAAKAAQNKLRGAHRQAEGEHRVICKQTEIFTLITASRMHLSV